MIEMNDVFEMVSDVLGEEEIEFIKMKEDDFVVDTHHTLGRWLRNNWGLWGKRGDVYDLCVKLGLRHPDDMTGVILTSWHRFKNNKKLDIENQVKYYNQYWKDTLNETEYIKLYGLKGDQNE